MTEVKHAGGIVSSSKVPALHLIPTEALLCLADRFQVGTERKGDGAWNALTKNQQCLDDNAFLIERCSHIIRHTMLLRDQLAHGFNGEEDSPYENAGAIIFGGALMACAMARAKTEMHFSCAMCGCDIPWGTTSCKDCMEYACEAVGMPVGHVPPEKRAEDSTAWVQLDPGGMTGTVVESPDDRVVQDRVPRRAELDWYRWVQTCGETSQWMRNSRSVDSISHGYIDQYGARLEVQCCRKDLPELRLIQPQTLAVGPKYECRNGQTVGPLGYNITQKTFFGTISDVTWLPTGHALKVDVGMSDEAERGWDIVKLVRE